MRDARASRALRVTIRVVIVQSVRAARRCRPWLERAADGVVDLREVAPCAAGLTRHAVAGGALAGALGAAQVFAGPGTGQLLKLALGLSVGAVAVSAALCAARRHSPPGSVVRVRALLVATTARVAPAHRQLLPARLLELGCAPGLALRALAPGSVEAVLEGALERAVTGQVVARIPGLSQVLDGLGVCRVSVSSALFVRDFELAARDLCTELGEEPCWPALNAATAPLALAA